MKAILMFGIPGTKWAATTCNLGKVRRKIRQSGEFIYQEMKRMLFWTLQEKFKG